MATNESGFRRVPRVSGPSSYQVSLWIRVLLPTFLVLLFGMGTLATVARPANPPEAYFQLYFGEAALTLAVGVVFGAVAILGRVQMGREQSSGYTWARQGYTNLAQIDPVSGVVIREPGEGDLPKRERADRVAAARAWAALHPESL